MTWPFENDTSAVVKRISNRSISANRKRNLFTIVTIALAAALLLAIMPINIISVMELSH